MSDKEGGAALKGLRLLTLDRGPEGYGFHMYTNKSLKGQYVKWVSPNSPAELGGMLTGDHVLEVDGARVTDESHHKVVERIRAGDGKDKTVLVIDKDTEKEMKKKDEEIDAANAIVMISRAATNTESDKEPSPKLEQSPGNTSPVAGGDEPDGVVVPPLQFDKHTANPGKGTRRAQVKARDWRSSIQAYNEL